MLTLLAIPAFPGVVPRANAVQLAPGQVTSWRPYGPYVSQVQVSVFTDEVTELAAFKAGSLDWYDWILPTSETNCAVNSLCLQNNPDALVTQPVGDAGATQFDFNHHMPWFGIPGEVPATFPAPGGVPANEATCGTTGVDVYGLACSTKALNPTTTLILKAVAHLFDKASWIAGGPCQGPNCVPLDDQIPNPVCTENVAPCSTTAQRVAWETPSVLGSRTTSCSVAITPCAYHLANGPANQPGVPSAADIQIAKDYLVAAGLTINANGRVNWSGNSADQIIFLIRTDDNKRLSMGTILANTLDSLFTNNGLPVVHRILGDIRVLGRFRQTVPLDDWNIYTGKWGLSLDATHLEPLYDSLGASNVCGGNQALSVLNYGIYCNQAFNDHVRNAALKSLSVSAFNGESAFASNIAGNDVLTIPIFTDSALTVGHNGWNGIVDVKGSGIPNSNVGIFNWFSMYQKSGYAGTTLGPPGGGNPNLLRAGFRQGTDKLNMFQAGTQWEAYVILAIFDSLGGGNPRSLTNPFFDPYLTGVTRVDQQFCASFSSCGLTPPAGTADATPITVLDFYLRNDMVFHDGVQVTANDFVKSCLAYRDVPAGGFGFASSCTPLLDSKVPVPGTTGASNSARMIMNGQSFLHKLNLLGIPILPLHVFDTNGDGFICGTVNIGSCAGRAADATTDPNYDPMAAGTMIGHGPFVCVNLNDPTKVGGPCSQTAAGATGGQSIGPGGRFLLTRNDNYYLGAPNVAGSALDKFHQADSVCATTQAGYRDWRISAADLSCAATPGHSSALQLLVISSLDLNLGAPTFGASAKVDALGNPALSNNVDTTDIGNTLFQLNP